MNLSNEQKQKIERFKAKWNAHIKKLTIPDGLEEYLKFFLSADENTLDQAISILAEQFEAKRRENDRSSAPNLSALKAFYFDLRKAEGGTIQNGGNCAHCRNAGYVNILVYNGKHCNPKFPFPAEPNTIESVVGSCVCRMGDFSQSNKARSRNVQFSFGPIDGFENNPENPLDLMRRYIGRCEELYRQQNSTT